MSDKSVFVSQTLTSVNGAAVNGRPVYVGANTVLVQTDGPAALAAIDVSNDKANWVEDTATLGDAVTAVTTRPRWVRPRVADDAGGPRLYQFGFNIYKETE